MDRHQLRAGSTDGGVGAYPTYIHLPCGEKIETDYFIIWYCDTCEVIVVQGGPTNISVNEGSE